MSDTPSLWPFAADLYARPGVEAALLSLQDDHGQCVAYLLWALWAAAAGRRLDDETLRAAAGLAGSWQEAAIAPLRGLRRDLKRPVAGAADRRRMHLREQVKGLELQAERMLLEMLEQMSPAPAGVSVSPARALAAAVAAWGGAAAPESLDRLAALVA
ncbi:MAG: TIGR02444 family protein [Caulobacterales bacterium]